MPQLKIETNVVANENDYVLDKLNQKRNFFYVAVMAAVFRDSTFS